jgi:hypothetical protein
VFADLDAIILVGFATATFLTPATAEPIEVFVMAIQKLKKK